MSGHVFISHSGRDDGFVKGLREALEGLGLTVRVISAIKQGDTAELEKYLNQVSKALIATAGAEVPLTAKTLLSDLWAILRGEHDPALAHDRNLNYQDAVELQPALEELGAA